MAIEWIIVFGIGVLFVLWLVDLVSQRNQLRRENAWLRSLAHSQAEDLRLLREHVEHVVSSQQYNRAVITRPLNGKQERTH